MPPLISLPEERSYYQTHENEPDRVLCWIPAQTLKEMRDKKLLDKKILTNFPNGMELNILSDEFDPFARHFGIETKEVIKTLKKLRRKQGAKGSDIVSAVRIENYVKRHQKWKRKPPAARRRILEPPLPKRFKAKMKKGPSPREVMLQVQQRGIGRLR